MSPFTPSLDYSNSIDRYRFLTILHAANECEECQFAKQAGNLWLANYPGDLFVQFHQAITFEGLSQHEQAVATLKELLAKDPEFFEPVKSLSRLLTSPEQQEEYHLLSLFLKQTASLNAPEDHWLEPLGKARQAFDNAEFDLAHDLILQSLLSDPPSPLPALLHLKTARQLDNQDMLNNLSEIYYQKWPKCLQINIIKAISEMDQGKEAAAVERLHSVAAQDSAGQVINRLLGINHRFRDLWPDHLEIYFDLPVPASVSAYLGWNQLISGESAKPDFKDKTNPGSISTSNSDEITQQIQLSTTKSNIETEALGIISEESPSEFDSAVMKAVDQTDPKLFNLEDIDSEETVDNFATTEELEEIKMVFSKLAKKLKKDELERADNRFPVYVVLSSKKRLEAVYGPNTAAIIDELLRKLVNLVQKLPDWGALLFYPDDPAQMAQFGLKPSLATDAWQVKMSLADLDSSLSKQGEMVGALLIVGGPEIVPYHHLPNPTQDSDLDVPSDNPYATVDENYFIPQWPVGRLPGESDSDAGLLLSQIRHVIYQYDKRAKTIKSGGFNFSSIFAWVINLINSIGRNVHNQKTKLGYSAEIWQEASRGVYKAVGNPNDLVLSPPSDSGSLAHLNSNIKNVGYFNLHGVKDGPHWYGQKDFSNASNGPDYPIALSPTMFNQQRPSPRVVITEACYGANVENKQNDNALSLKFLDSGTATFIGSTCIAYGSVTLPLIAADYLAEKTWQQILDGQPAGYALNQAKLSLVEEMARLQGFLDGEDQKTVLSFVLFGDPLAIYNDLQTMPKPLFRAKSSTKVKTISDSDMIPTFDNTKMPKNVSKEVKKVVEKYLPGLDNAQMHMSKSYSDTEFIDQAKGNLIPERYVVTLQKSFNPGQDTIHQHFARMTFNKKGKLVKFTTSR